MNPLLVKEFNRQYDCESKYQSLLTLIREEILLYQPWLKMLDNLKRDREHCGKIYAGALHAPAGKGNHHAYPGGWLDHALEMWQVYKMWQKSGLLDKDQIFCESERVFKGIILHDLHKTLYEFYYTETEAGTVSFDYGNHSFKNLITNNFQSLYIANIFGIQLDPLDLNCLTCSEGGYAKDPPKFQSVLAKLVYLLDEISSNVISRNKTKTFLNVKESYTENVWKEINPL